MCEKNEFKLRVPADLARSFKGLCIDAGSSIVRFVYKSKEDEDEAKSGDSKYGHLHLVSFPRPELSKALEYVRQHAVVTRSGAESPTIYTTGFGCTNHGKLISETLDVKLQQLTEFDCFVKSFTYLAARLPRSEFLEPFLDEATVQPVEAAMKLMELFQAARDKNISEAMSSCDFSDPLAGIQQVIGKPSEAALQAGDVPLSEAEPDMYPCLVALCGSGYGFMKVEQDGSFKFVDMSNRGGRAFFGLGSLLTGYKTFSELIEAASKGDERFVNQYHADLVKVMDSVEGEDSWYTTCGEGSPADKQLVFCFGKAVGSELGKFKREDLARALLTLFVLDLVQCVQLVCRSNDIKRVFFCGGMTSSPLVRSMITTEYVRRNFTLLAFGMPPDTKFDFVRPGAHLGALGCVVHDIEKTTASS